MILLIILVVLLFGGGGGYYGYSRWGRGGGLGIVWTVLLFALVLYLVGGARWTCRHGIEAEIHKLNGKVKERVERATNNPDLESEGQAEKIGGEIQK